jgi:tetratricopeptide (TPR) repeat protein
MSEVRKLGLFAMASRWFGVGVFALAIGLAGCSSPEEKAEAYYQKGETLLQKGDLVKASLEFKNALQIKNNMTKAWLGLAAIAERQADWPKLYGLLNKVVELDPKNLDAHVKLGRLLLAAGQLDKALDASKAALALNKDDESALTLRAAVLFKLDDKQGAVEQANAVLAKNPNNVDALVVLASERLLANDPAKAIEYLDRGLKQNDKNVGLQLIKIQALDKMADSASAEAVYKKLIAYYPEERAFRHALAAFYLKHNRPADAEAEYRAIVAMHPNDLAAKLDVVRFLSEVKGPQAARQELASLVAKEPDNVDLQFALAGFDMMQKNVKSAEDIYKSIIAKGGAAQVVIKAKGLLAASMLSTGDKKGAGDLVADILGQDERNEQALLIKASMEIDDRKLDQAIADLRTIQRDAPNSVKTQLLLGKAYELSSSPELADESYQKAYQGSKNAAAYGIAYADFLLKRNQPDRAEKILEQVVDTDPGNILAMKMLAQARINKGDWSGAQQVADKLKGMGDQGKVSDQIMGTIFANKKDYAESISAFKHAAEAAPNDAQPVMSLVRAYLMAGKPGDALNFVNSVLQTNPNNNNFRLLQGQLYGLKGDQDQAIQAFTTVISKDPKNPAGYRELASLYLRAKRYADADKAIAQGLAAVPGDAGLRVIRASEYELAGKVDDAIREYQSLLKEHPNADVLANNLASLLSEYRTDKASLDQAVELAKRFERSDVPQFKDTLGWADYKVGRTDDAISLLQSATDAMPNQAIFHYHLGMSYLAKKDKVMAKKELQKALELAGNGSFAQADEIRKTLQTL